MERIENNTIVEAVSMLESARQYISDHLYYGLRRLLAVKRHTSDDLTEIIRQSTSSGPMA